jgi:ribosomal protein S27AE
MNKSDNQKSTLVNDSPITNHNSPIDSEDTVCPRCSESHDLAKVKGCIKCLKCGYKFDCNGW